MGKPIERLGDIGSGHSCYPPRPIVTSSPNVFVDGIPVSRVGDSYAPHACPHTSPHGASQAGGSPTIKVNGSPVSRIGDAISCGSVVATASTSSFA